MLLASLSLLPLSSVMGQRNTAHLSTQDSIRLFTDSALNLVEERSLYTGQIEWDVYRPTFLKKVLAESQFLDILPHFITLWDTLGDDHSGIDYAGEWYSTPSTLDTTAFSEGLAQAFRERKNWSIQTEVLAEQYGYIAVPSINTLSDSIATQQAANVLQDSLCQLMQSDVKGWIVDLRRNLGGNMYAMIAGIHQLVAPDTFSFMLDQHEQVYSFWRVDNKRIYEGEKAVLMLPLACQLRTLSPKVAVLVGPLTASSGEITALAFLGQPNVTIIGEPSAGYMTANEVYDLPFGAYMSLAEVYETDRQQKKIVRIQPDLVVKGGDDFGNLLRDTKVRAALAWLRQ